MLQQEPAESRSVTLFDAAWELVFVTLLVVGLVRFLAAAHPAALTAAVLIATAVLLGWRIGCLAVGRARPSRSLELVALAGTSLGTVVLVALSADFVWIVFPVFLWCFQLIRPAVSIPCVAALAVLATASGIAYAPAFDVGQVLGPLIGAVAAGVMALAHRSLAAENEQRRRLIADLESTREDLRTTEREAATLAERERLAREIHDTITQGLSSVTMLLRAADAQLDADPETAREHVRLALRTTTENLAEARRFVHALTSPALDDAGIDQALDGVCRRLGEETGIDARFTVKGEPRPLDADAQLALFRVAQSAIGNVRRHAQAHRVDVTITFLEDAVNLDVVDDGVGFDPMAPPDGVGGGFGLRAMSERLRTMGGALVVESSPGSGAAIVASLPTGPGAGP